LIYSKKHNKARKRRRRSEGNGRKEKYG